MSSIITEKSLWKAVQAEMQLNLSDLNYNMWIAKTEPGELTENSLEVICPNNHVKNKLESLYMPMLTESVNKVGKGEYEIILTTVGSKPKKDHSFEEPLFQNLEADQKIDAGKFTKAGLNPKYRLDNYIMGNTNRLAYAIASSIAENPGKMHNPMFLYAGVGLGKTHLIQAVGNKVLENDPNAKVIYCTGEKFTNELIESIQNKKGGRSNTDSFRRKYRKADILIIDDVQFIAGKEATQEEFFHTFNDLYMAQKQIVLASDRPPEEFKNIEERITSRFRSGIMADIQPPDYELRTAILRAKRDESNDEFPNDVIDFIAENVTTNIRELEGAYIQVFTYAKATGEELNVETAKKALENVIQNGRDKPVNNNAILKAVCNYYSIKMPDIKGKRRTKEFVIPRQIAMYLMYNLTQTPYMSIGETLGGRDHTTVMHGVKKVEDGMKVSVSTKNDVTNIKQFIYNN